MEEEDVYITQLRDVFESCDLEGKGFLDRSELIDLCQRLQLDDQIPAILSECIGDGVSDGKVQFNTFKDAFVAVLSNTIDSMAEATEEDRSEFSDIIDTESEPYKVFNNKKYGRRSQQKTGSSIDDATQSDGDLEAANKRKKSIESTPKSHKPLVRRSSSRSLSRKLSRRSSGGLPAALRRKLSTPPEEREGLGKEEILEGSGAMDSMLNAEVAPEDVISSDDIEQLKEIFEELAVGVSGYLDMQELSIVCEHIGMDNIQDQELELLFKELDQNDDGLVSFDEFLHGLFLATKHQTSQDNISVESPIIPVSSNNNNVEMDPELTNLQPPILSPRHNRRASSVQDDNRVSKKVDILSFLDHANTGWSKKEQVDEYLRSLGLGDVKGILMQLQPNAEGEINLKELTKTLESMIHERGDSVSEAVLQAYLHEINHLSLKMPRFAPEKIRGMIEGSEETGIFDDNLSTVSQYDRWADDMAEALKPYVKRGELESVTSERNQLKGSVSKFGVDSTMLIRESEEQTRQVEQQYEKKLDQQDKLFNGRLQQKELEWQSDHSQLRSSFIKEKADLEGQLKSSKAEENKLKDKLMEAEAEIDRLQQNVLDAIADLEEEQRKSLRLEKDLEANADIQRRIIELESSRELLRDQYTSQARTVTELEQIKKELRDENDELQVQLENLKAQLNTMGKKKHRRRHTHSKAEDDSVSERSRGKGHRSKESPKVSKVGSYLSDYTKPVIIKRNDEGETTEEEDADEDVQMLDDDESASPELKKKVREQDAIIGRLREDLESTQKMLEGDVGEARVKYERDLLKMNQSKTEEIAELQTQFDIERKDLIDKYENKLMDLEQNHSTEKEAIISGFLREKEEIQSQSDTEKVGRAEIQNSEKKKLENIFKQEKEETDLKYKSKVTKLKEQIVILETDKAEMELKFVNEKAEMEQQFRTRFADLEGRFDLAKIELERARDEIERLKEELAKRPQNDNYETERKWRNEISSLEAEKAELQMTFLNEKTEIEQSYRVRILELEQKLSSTVRDYEQVQADLKLMEDEHMKKHKYSVEDMERKWKFERGTFEREKSELELRFMNEIAELEQKYRINMSELEQKYSSANRDLERSRKEIELLKEELANKYEGDVNELERKWNKEKEDLVADYGNEKEDLIKTHKKEINELRKSFSQQLLDAEKHYTKEISSLRDEHKKEKRDLEQKYGREKKELRENIENEHEHEMAVKISDFRKQGLQEKIEFEKGLNEQNRKLSQELKQAKMNYEKEIQKLKSEMEIGFLEEKAKIEEQLVAEKEEVEERYKIEIADLQKVFEDGEEILKEQMKSEFEVMVEAQKQEIEERYEEEKVDLMESFVREKAELELSWQVEKAEMEENFDTEKSELEDTLRQEKEELSVRFTKQREKVEADHRKEIEILKKRTESELNSKVGRETQLLEKTVEHLENELNSLKEQKKELETKVQSLELKQLSQLQDAHEIDDFKKEKSIMQSKITSLDKEVQKLRKDKEIIERQKEELSQEKTTILENSVKEITDQQEFIYKVEAEKDRLQGQVLTLRKTENDAVNLKNENSRLQKQIVECQKEITDLEKLRYDLKSLENTARQLESKNRSLETVLQEKDISCSRMGSDVKHLQDKLENMENVHKKELEAQRERLNMTTTAATTEKSRYLREIQEIREQLNRATVAGERDQALKAKVFNDAKAEVMTLNRKLEEKSRYIKDMENREKGWEAQMEEIKQAKKNLENQLKEVKESLHENNGKYSKEKHLMDVKSTRSDNLVQELYIENASLTKQLYEADVSHRKVEKQLRQLIEQKKALQRVITKLCGAHSLA